MHNPNPHQLTQAEWREIGNLQVIRESWGLESEQDPLELASLAYGARFEFVSGGPGYVGDLCIIQGDSMCEPMILYRDRAGRLTAC